MAVVLQAPAAARSSTVWANVACLAVACPAVACETVACRRVRLSYVSGLLVLWQSHNRVVCESVAMLRVRLCVVCEHEAMVFGEVYGWWDMAS